MDFFSIQQVIISVVTSVVAGLIVIRYTKYRENKIKAQIEDIESYEGYLEKLSKGNIKLLRTSFAILFSCLFLFFSAAAILVLVTLLGKFPYLQYVLCVISMSAFTSSAGICFYQARSIIHSSNLTDTKKQLAAKKEILSTKIT